MRVLLDNNLSPRLVPILSASGWDVAHVRAIGLRDAEDGAVLEAARSEDRILISADTDFGALLASGHVRTPSVVLVRRVAGRRVEALAALLLANLPEAARAAEERQSARRVRRQGPDHWREDAGLGCASTNQTGDRAAPPNRDQVRSLVDPIDRISAGRSLTAADPHGRGSRAFRLRGMSGSWRCYLIKTARAPKVPGR